ncbi:PREDICTED: mitotic-spindle organizing [Prunus dulcis]|uniref:PREDICTED: mitotic-spindle organizing n=4 Tax=Prunus TaxID=3754 RepID=A0A5E4F1P5_PRUDU|nr:hypothetical protein L3X38_043024 [Prunus dulcis]VVA21985.1 PREDICTED: mitotic-spindle organizing [Prunus dulcis]
MHGLGCQLELLLRLSIHHHHTSWTLFVQKNPPRTQYLPRDQESNVGSSTIALDCSSAIGGQVLLCSSDVVYQLLNMDAVAAKTARESLDLAFQMSNILDTGLDRHTLSILIALCDLGLNPEALAAVVKELRTELVPLPPSDAAHAIP